MSEPLAQTQTGSGVVVSAPSLVLGKYELLAPLGRGGMAHVYLAVARDAFGGGRVVVVKRLRADDAHSPERVRMFLDELCLAVRLEHPHVVRTLDAGVENEEGFLVLEYLEGRTLSEVSATLRGRGVTFPHRAAARVVSDALLGLHYAHELKGEDGASLEVVHRDVTPDNLFITFDGQVKVLDFGVAKALLHTRTSDARILKGKVGYMAPEAASGVVIDRRADVYAAGVVLWELVAGRSMRAPSNVAASLARLVFETCPPLSTAVPTVDPYLEAIVTRALSRDPEERFPTALAMREALETYLATPGEPASAEWLARSVLVHLADERDLQARRVRDYLAAAGSPLVPTLLPRRTARRSTIVVVGLLAGMTLGLGVVGAWVLRQRHMAVPAPLSVERSAAAAPVTVVVDPPARSALPAGPPSSDPSPRPPPTSLAAPSKAPRLPRAAVAPPKPAPHAAPRPVAAIAPGPAGSTGFLTLDTYPWARVTWNGRSLGTTPLVKISMPAGTHTLALENPEQNLHTTVTVTVTKGNLTAKRMAFR